jgi:hypothetical protein
MTVRGKRAIIDIGKGQEIDMRTKTSINWRKIKLLEEKNHTSHRHRQSHFPSLFNDSQPTAPDATLALDFLVLVAVAAPSGSDTFRRVRLAPVASASGLSIGFGRGVGREGGVGPICLGRNGRVVRVGRASARTWRGERRWNEQRRVEDQYQDRRMD